MTHAVGPECASVLAGISAYLDGELGAAACDAIERHCRTCPSCASLVDGLRETIGLCRGAALVPIPDDIRDKAHANISALLKAGKT
jgi:anti-sigma factor RsiW